MSTPSFVCIDLETTGLSVEECCILEVGIVIADENLETVAANSWLVAPATDLSEMNDFVTEMHTKNGLLAELQCGEGMSAWATAGLVIEWLTSLGLEAGVFPMFGSSVGFDRGFLKEDMYKLEAWFHYRNIDISTVKELARTWRPDLKWKPKGSKAHRSVDDCLATLDEARYYKNEIFVTR